MLAVDRWIDEIGLAGQELSRLGAAEGAAGNISLFLPDDTPGLRGFCLGRFPRDSPYTVPAGISLPAGTLLVTGTGRRLRDVRDHPDSTLCAIEFEPDGTAWLHRSKQHKVMPTSEFDSHLLLHETMLAGVARSHAIVHAQPPNLTYLTHIPEYRDRKRFNRQIMRWQPETIVMLPTGLRFVEFVTPGTPELGERTRDIMHRCPVAIWAKHGVISRSYDGPVEAADLIDYAETAAAYEVRDLIAGRPADGLSLDELRKICSRFNVSPALLNELPADLMKPGNVRQQETRTGE